MKPKLYKPIKPKYVSKLKKFKGVIIIYTYVGYL